MDLEHLAKLGEYLEAISVWNIASVEDEPDTKLTQWRIFSVRGGAISPDGKETVHFVGYTDGWHGEGRVCSAVQTFDGATRKGVTKSGRIYELVGDPGYNRDAMYVWSRWLSINGDPEVEDITDSYPAKVVAEAANQAAGTTVSTATPGAVMTIAATWGQQAASAAEGFARALGIAAKELGVTVNDFLHTDAGKLTAALIIWKVAGAAFIHMLYGMLFITVGLTIVRVIYMRLFTKGYEQVGYSYFGGFFKGTKLVRVPKSFQDMHNDGEWLAFWVMIGVTMVTIGIGGTFF